MSVNPKNVYRSKKGVEYITLAVAWVNSDGSIRVVANEYLKPGERIFLSKNIFKKPNSKQPDYRYSVELERYDEVEGEVLEKETSEIL